MTSVFLAPGLLKNVRRSIIEGVQIGELNFGGDRSLADVVAKKYEAGSIKLWATKKTLTSVWRKCKEGDLLLIYHRGRFVYVGEIFFKYPFVENSAQIEAGATLAESVWGRDVSGQTWPYIIFLKDVREIDIPLPKFKEITGYKISAVFEFMRVREDVTNKLIDYVQGSKPKVQPQVKGEEMQHDKVGDIIYEIGEVIGYEPQKKWRYEGFEYDVVWNKPPRVGPSCIFEVQLKGSTELALTKLKHANDLWSGSRLFFVSTEDQIKRVETKFLGGAFHELMEEGALTLVKIDEMKQFYEFKGKFEWLERKFGLKPRA